MNSKTGVHKLYKHIEDWWMVAKRPVYFLSLKHFFNPVLQTLKENLTISYFKYTEKEDLGNSDLWEENQLKNRQDSSFVHLVFKEMQLISFQWSLSDVYSPHKQVSYFTESPCYFKIFASISENSHSPKTYGQSPVFENFCLYATCIQCSSCCQ